MLRHVMEARGADTSILGPAGLQPERIFKPLLELEEAKSAFGEDAVFEMQNVLVDSLGGNLRNEVLHGLLPDDRLFGAEVFYAWWLLLRYCVAATPLVQQQRKNQISEASIEASVTELSPDASDAPPSMPASE